MVDYKKIGLVNTREMFKKAVNGGYAIPAFNFNNMEQMQAIIQAAVETKSPVILQVSKGARDYANATLLRYMAEGAVEYAKELGCPNPQIVLHLDHGDSFETCKSCIDSGFSSVMYDGSALPYEENIRISRQVVEYAHAHDVTVECELGVLAGVEDEVASEVSHYTKPEEVIDFATRTGCDSLAISIGTSHGAYKFKPEQCTVDPQTGRLVPPPLAFDVLEAIEQKLPGFPIVGGHHQRQRWRPEGRRGYPRGAAAQGRQERRVQDQHRQRQPPGDDRRHPQAHGRAPRPLRPAPVPEACTREHEEDVRAQDCERAGFQRQALIHSGIRDWRSGITI